MLAKVFRFGAIALLALVVIGGIVHVQLGGDFDDAVRLVWPDYQTDSADDADTAEGAGGITLADAIKQGRIGTTDPRNPNAPGPVPRPGNGQPRLPASPNAAAMFEAMMRDPSRIGDVEDFLRSRLQVIEKAVGPDNPEFLQLTISLATLLVRQERYSEAEPLMKRAVEITEKAYGAKHFMFARSLTELGQVLQFQARLDEAEPLHRRALAVIEVSLGRDHPEVGRVLHNLATVLVNQARYDEALEHYQRALTLAKKHFGPRGRNVATVLLSMAPVYSTQGRHGEAAKVAEESLSILEEAVGKKHPAVNRALVTLAAVYQADNRLDDAAKLFKRSLALIEETFGRDHPSLSFSLAMLAANAGARKDWRQAVTYMRRGTRILSRRPRAPRGAGARTANARDGITNPHQRLTYRGLVGLGYRLADAEPQRRDALAAEMFEAAQRAFASEAAASLAQMAARQATGSGALADLVRERQDLTVEWQKRDSRRTAAVAQPADRRDASAEQANATRLAAIDTRIGEIDQRLRQDFPDYTALANPQPVALETAQRHLGENEALVMILDPDKAHDDRAATFIWVVTRTAVRWVRSALDARTLRDHVDALRCGLDYDGAWKGTRCFDLLGVVYSGDDAAAGKPLPFSLARSHALYAGLFGAVEDLIAGKDLVIVTSGALTQLPFQVLVTTKPAKDELSAAAFTEATWLAKQHALTVLPSVASLQALRAHTRPSAARRPFIGFGNPLLTGPDDSDRSAWDKQSCAGLGPITTASARAGRAARLAPATAFRGDLADIDAVRRQYPLPETADELCAVARASGVARPDDAVMLGARAGEATLKQLAADGVLADTRVLHFATHGLVAGETRSLTGSRAEPALMMTPPATATSADDGLLTASEVAALKLDAEWVILSACNTAAGNATDAAALSGLARAFFYAGARALLVSHWYVDSQATVALITKAFAALAKDPKIGRARALQQAMLSLQGSAKTRFWHPAYWAPFVVVGEGAG